MSVKVARNQTIYRLIRSLEPKDRKEIDILGPFKTRLYTKPFLSLIYSILMTPHIKTAFTHGEDNYLIFFPSAKSNESAYRFLNAFCYEASQAGISFERVEYEYTFSVLQVLKKLKLFFHFQMNEKPLSFQRRLHISIFRAVFKVDWDANIQKIKTHFVST